MKKIVSVIIICVLVLVGCEKSNVTKLELKPDSFASDKINFDKPRLDEYISRYGYDTAVDNYIDNNICWSGTYTTNMIEIEPVDTIYGSFIRFSNIYSSAVDPMFIIVDKDKSCKVFGRTLLEHDCEQLIEKNGIYFVDQNTKATQDQIESFKAASSINNFAVFINDYQFMQYQQFNIDDITEITKGGAYILTRDYCHDPKYMLSYDGDYYHAMPEHNCTSEDVITVLNIGSTLFERHMLFKESTDSIDIIGYVYIQV